jgi:sucrose-6-phosphate hydrolase SacC (GH32 family)
LLAALCPVLAVANLDAAEPDLLLGDFESNDWSGWTTAGNAFGAAPFRPGTNRFPNHSGKGIAWSGRSADDQGELLSPAFKIQRPYINFLVAGDRDLPSRVGVELVAEGRVLRASSATEFFTPAMEWRSWDVAELVGRTAQVRINDHASGASIAVDAVCQSDSPKAVATDARKLLHETLRPQFHFTPQTGWMNDANGLLWYRGEWHLFHQHRLPGSEGVAWGHAASLDLVHWRHLPTAIPNDRRNASFSGSGLVDWTNASRLRRGDDPPILLFYTLHPPTDSGRKATQCMAFSTDGARTFEKFPGNPVLQTRDNNDRDPKVFFHPPTGAWFMVLSLSRNNTDREHATYGLFRSRDLKVWNLIQEIGPGAWYWECPDLFEICLDGDPHRTRWLLVKGSGDYIVGTFDGQSFKPETDPIRANWHNSYYGAQTFNDAPGKRRVQIGWMNVPKAQAHNAWPGMPFNQQMSFPREITLRSTPTGPRVFSEPVAEIAQLHANTRSLGPRTLAPGENALARIMPGLIEIECDLDLPPLGRLSLKCRGAELSYDVQSGKMRLLRADPMIKLADGQLTLRVLIDRTSIEAFVNGGQADLCGVYFPDPDDQTLALTVEGGQAQIRRLIVHELKSIWTEPSTPRNP